MTIADKRSYTHHGMTGTKLHEVWKEMLRRCKPYHQSSSTYFARGISVCKEWHKANVFIMWALDNGYTEGLEIDRRNNDKGYSPENCRFVTHKVNSNNRSDTRYIEYGGKRLCLSMWSELTGIPHSTLSTRLFRGWSIKDALTRKVQQRLK